MCYSPSLVQCYAHLNSIVVLSRNDCFSDREVISLCNAHRISWDFLQKCKVPWYLVNKKYHKTIMS